jgi:hypothetical protein
MARGSKEGTYYLGRIVLQGVMTKDDLVHLLKKPKPIQVGEYSWTITDFKAHEQCGKKYYFGKLTKYQPEAEVDVVDIKTYSEIKKDIENAKIASSTFIYLPDYSGIAYLHVWNRIEQETFVRRFTAIVLRDQIMVDCNIDPVSDLAAFYKRISSLDKISCIQAKVHPPNPLFGHMWKELKEFLEKRKTAELKIEERAVKGEDLLSNIKKAVRSVEENQTGDQKIDITDAAILMAADGYGTGKIQGSEGKNKVVVATGDTVKNFKFSSDPKPEELFVVADGLFKDISEKRHMEHAK